MWTEYGEKKKNKESMEKRIEEKKIKEYNAYYSESIQIICWIMLYSYYRCPDISTRWSAFTAFFFFDYLGRFNEEVLCKN